VYRVSIAALCAYSYTDENKFYRRIYSGGNRVGRCGLETVVVSCNEPSGSIKGGEFVD